MKKLIAMIGAAAMAFGLYAEEPENPDSGFLAGTAFEADDGGNSWNSEKGLATGFWVNYQDVASVIAGQNAIPRGSHPAKFSDVGDTQVIKIATTLGNPVLHNVKSTGGTQDISTGLYFDGLVKFTLFDPGDEPAAEDAKIAVYPLLESDDGDAYLTVLANDANGKPARYTTATKIAADTWYRLTIKAIADIDGNGQTGFMVFVNGNAAADVVGAKIESGLLPKYAEWGIDGKIFRSMIASDATVKAVGFDGKGEVDEIAFTTTAPSFAVDPTGATVGWDTTKVQGISVTEGGELLPATPNPAFVALSSLTGGKVYYKAVDGFVDGYITVADGDTPTIGNDVVAAVASFAGKGYATVAEAVTEANKAEADGTLKLYSVPGMIALNNVNGKVITLDLNGWALNMPVSVQGGSVVIDDSAATAGSVGTLASVVGTTVTIKDGFFGNVNVLGTLVIPSGSTAEFFNPVSDQDTSLAINNANDLKKLALVVNAGYATANKTFKQTDNIALTEAFDGIGKRDMKNTLGSSLANYTSANVFKGTYDGGDFTVSGVILKTGDYIGFFNSTYGATIKNLKISLGNATGWSDTASDQVGAVFVGVSVNTTIQGCQTLVAGEEGAYNTFKATKTAAGIVGFAANGTVIKGCVNNLNIWSAANVKGGGLIACAQADKSSGEGVEIEGCSNNGNVKSAASSSEPYCAGLVGYADLKITLKGANSVGKDVVLESTSATPGTPKSLIHVNNGSVVVDDGATFTVPAGYMTCNKACDGLFFATVDNGVATLVKNADVELEGSYKVMAPGAAYEFTKEGSITFDNSLVPTFVPTADEAQFDLSNVGYVWTCTVKPTTVDFSVKAGENSSIKEVEINGEVVAGELPVKLNENDTYKVTFEPTAGYAFADGEDGIRSGKAEKDAINVTGPDASLIPVESVTIDQGETAEVEVGKTLKLTATVAPETVLDKTVTWTSDDTTKATVADDGVVTGVADGVVVITAAAGGKSDTITITVKSAAAPLPAPIQDGTEEQQKAYEKWAQDNGVTSDAAINAVAFALELDVVNPANIEAETQAKLDDVLETEAKAAAEVAKFSDDYTPDYFSIDGYPNAKFIFVETKAIESDNGKFFRLTAEFNSLKKD